MQLSEKETELIREHVRLTLIMNAIIENIKAAEDERGMRKEINTRFGKAFGTMFRGRFEDVKKELRSLGIYAQIDDNDSQVIFAKVTFRGQKLLFDFRRKILEEEIEHKIKVLSDEIISAKFECTSYSVDLQRHG